MAQTTQQRNIAALTSARDHWNEGRLEKYLELYHPSIALYGYAGVEPGFANVRGFYQGFFAAFSASTLRFDDVFASGDRVACRFVVEATHSGPFNGVPATGTRVVLPGITILRFVEGRCVERWSQADFLGLLAQLGALSQPG